MTGYVEAPRQKGTLVCIAFPGEPPRGGYVIVDVAEQAMVSRRGAVSSTIVPWSWVLVRKK
jgi:hypothetical protein